MANINFRGLRGALWAVLFVLIEGIENPIRWVVKAIGEAVGLFGNADFIISASKPDHWAYPMIVMIDGLWPFAKPVLQLLVIYFILRLHLEEANRQFAKKEQFDTDHARLDAHGNKIDELETANTLMIDRINELEKDLNSANVEIAKLKIIYDHVENMKNQLALEMKEKIDTMFDSKQQEYSNEIGDTKKDYTIRIMNLDTSLSRLLERVQELEDGHTVAPPASPLIGE